MGEWPTFATPCKRSLPVFERGKKERTGGKRVPIFWGSGHLFLCSCVGASEEIHQKKKEKNKIGQVAKLLCFLPTFRKLSRFSSSCCARPRPLCRFRRSVKIFVTDAPVPPLALCMAILPVFLYSLLPKRVWTQVQNDLHVVRKRGFFGEPEGYSTAPQ